MATILLLGSDEALLEGLSQSLNALGHRTVLTHHVGEAMEAAHGERPLIAILPHAAVADDPSVLRLPTVPGGALVLYRAPGEKPLAALNGSKRGVLADLVLPLERHRLTALVQHVEERIRATGREQALGTRPERPRA